MKDMKVIYEDMKNSKYSVEYWDTNTFKKCKGIDFDRLKRDLDKIKVTMEDFLEYAKLMDMKIESV